jgi:hypothetical protein
MEHSDFFVTEELLQKWREATDIQTEYVTKAPTNSGYVILNDFFSATLSEFVIMMRPLRASVLQDMMTIDDLYNKIEKSSIAWEAMKEMYIFYTQKCVQNSKDVGLQALDVHWNKIENLFNLRLEAISVYDKIQQVRRLEEEVARLSQELQINKQKSEALKLSAQQMGVKQRTYTREYGDGILIKNFTGNHMHALLLALSTQVRSSLDKDSS